MGGISDEQVQQKPRLRNEFLFLFLAFVTLGIYYPAILGEFFILDDLIRLKSLVNAGTMDFSEFLGFGASNVYRRPATLLVHYGIYKIAGDQPTVYHLFNVILHVANGILIYSLISFLLNQKNRISFYGLLAALIFILHPVNVESVAWISGNSGVMATFFVLTALSLHIRTPGSSNQRIWLAACFYFVSLLVKESALLMALAFAWWDVHNTGTKLRDAVARNCRRWIPYGVALAAYLLVRVSESLWSWNSTAKGGSFSLDSFTSLFVKPVAGLGFYLKKLIFPWPLDFHIGHIALIPYFLLGTAFILILIVGMARRRWQAFWGWSFVCGLGPVLALTILGTSWTPVAERYLYLSSVFFSVFIALSVRNCLARFSTFRTWLQVVPILVLVVFAVNTTRRAELWQTSREVLEDTLRQSPEEPFVLTTYGVLLAKSGRLKDAEAYWQKAYELGEFRESPMCLGTLEKLRGNYKEAEQYFLKAAWPSANVMAMTRSFNPRIYLALGELHRDWALEERSGEKEHYERAIHFYKRAYEFSGQEAFILYTLGKIYLRQGNLKEARNCFRQVYAEEPDTYYGRAAAKLMHVNSMKTEGSDCGI